MLKVKSPGWGVQAEVRLWLRASTSADPASAPETAESKAYSSKALWTTHRRTTWHTHLICASHPAILLCCSRPLSLAPHHVPLRLFQEFLHLASLLTAHCPLACTVKTDIKLGHASITSHLSDPFPVCNKQQPTMTERFACFPKRLSRSAVLGDVITLQHVQIINICIQQSYIIMDVGLLSVQTDSKDNQLLQEIHKTIKKKTSTITFWGFP